jgi:hypothetical protein
VTRDCVGRVLVQGRIVGQGEAPVDDRVVQAGRGGHHPGILLGEGRTQQALALQLGGDLLGVPRIEGDLLDPILACQLTDVVPGLQQAILALEHGAADLEAV